MTGGKIGRRKPEERAKPARDFSFSLFVRSRPEPFSSSSSFEAPVAFLLLPVRLSPLGSSLSRALLTVPASLVSFDQFFSSPPVYPFRRVPTAPGTTATSPIMSEKNLPQKKTASGVSVGRCLCCPRFY
jgi:hypothetical protein